jgi:hypothetical protein
MIEMLMSLGSNISLGKIKVVLFVGIVTGAFWAGTEWTKGQIAQEEVEEHTEEVETHNENVITQDNHEAAMLKLERDLRKKLTRGPRADVSDDCPVDQLTVMRQSKIDRFNSTLFPVTD